MQDHVREHSQRRPLQFTQLRLRPPRLRLARVGRVDVEQQVSDEVPRLRQLDDPLLPRLYCAQQSSPHKFLELQVFGGGDGLGGTGLRVLVDGGFFGSGPLEQCFQEAGLGSLVVGVLVGGEEEGHRLR